MASYAPRLVEVGGVFRIICVIDEHGYDGVQAGCGKNGDHKQMAVCAVILKQYRQCQRTPYRCHARQALINGLSDEHRQVHIPKHPNLEADHTDHCSDMDGGAYK